jgi:amidophosphoribosyltransferase
MGGVFGVVSNNDCVTDLFFGTDYHSHLGTKRGGMCVYGENGFNRAIHDIENSPFRTKFEKEVEKMSGTMGIGCISDSEPQPLTVFSKMGDYSISTVGRINNKKQLMNELLQSGCNQFMSMSGGEINNTELVAALISTENDFITGIRYAQEKIEGSITILLMTPEGIYAARDKYGRTPLIIGKKKGSYCVASESFAFINLGYKTAMELGPAEIVFLTPSGFGTIVEPGEKMRICTFLWTYFGYPTSTYEGVNVEEMRYRNGTKMAEKDLDIEADYVAGVPDSGTAHTLGYANKSGIPLARPLIKYTPTWPRSFTPQNKKTRDLIARMKLVPIHSLIKDKKLVMIDDSIVRGTQLTGTVKYLYEYGAKEIHVRSACPPVMFGCKYLNFTRTVIDKDLITRRTIEKLEGGNVTREILEEYVDNKSKRHANMVEDIRKQLNFTSLKYHTLEDMLEAVGINKCKLCTYCWNGKE